MTAEIRAVRTLRPLSWRGWQGAVADAWHVRGEAGGGGFYVSPDPRLVVLTGDGAGGFGIGRIVEDLDGDGHADLLLAAWNSGAGAPNAGKAFVYSGADGSVFATLTHDVQGAQFGFDANGMNDVDGDGRDDYLITAAWDSQQRGAAYLIRGVVGPDLVGDFDGDGSVDAGDLAVLLAAWGACPPDDCAADLDGDDVVGAGDLALLLAAWTG